MTLSLIEAAVDSVVNWLRDNMPAHVALINAAHASDGLSIEIAPPADYGVAEFRWRALPPTPCVAVLAEEITIAVDSNNYLSTRHAMSVIVVDMDADQNVLRRRLFRHVQAIVNCLLAGLQARAFVLYWQNDLTMARFSPVAILDQTYAADAQIFIAIQQEETY